MNHKINIHVKCHLLSPDGWINISRYSFADADWGLTRLALAGRNRYRGPIYFLTGLDNKKYDPYFNAENIPYEP